MTDVDAYLGSLDGEARDWTAHFVNYMRERHPDCEELLYFGMPTYRPVPGDRRKFIAFSVASAHLSMHTLDFDFVLALRARFQKPGKGKGCVNVAFKNADERAVLEKAIDELVARMRG